MTALRDISTLLAQGVQRARAEPQWFLDNILRCDYDDWQLELLEAVADLDRIKNGIPTRYNHDGLTRFSIVSCHGTGKTTVLAMLSHWYQFTHVARIPTTAPKEKQLVLRLWPAFRGLLGNADVFYKAFINVECTKITWGNDPDWAMLVETASVPENLQGYHPTATIPDLMFLVEEASGVPDQMFEAIDGALSTEGALLVLIGNPTRTQGEFYRSHCDERTSPLYYHIHVTPERSKFVDHRWVDTMRRKYGERSPVYLVRARGEFAELAENQLINLTWLENARLRDPVDDGSHPTLRVSVDVADGGIDETVVTVGQRYQAGTHLVKIHRFSFPAETANTDTADAAERIFKAHGGKKDTDEFVVDAVGVGAGVASTLVKRGYKVIRFKGGSTTGVSKEYRNRRVQSALVLRDGLRDGWISIADEFCADDDWDELCTQTVSVKSKPGVEKVEDLQSKQDMARAGIKSPDMFESIAMQFTNQLPYRESGPMEAYEDATLIMETSHDAW